MSGLVEVLADAGVFCGDRYCGTMSGPYRAKKCVDCADVIDATRVAVLAWVAAGLDGAREELRGDWERASLDERFAIDAALAVVRDALGVPSGLRGSHESDEERSVGFGGGSDDEGGSE